MEKVKLSLKERLRETVSGLLGRRRLIGQVKKIFRRRRPAPVQGGKKVLFFPLGYFEVALTWELTLMKALEGRGHECRNFLCDLPLPMCELRLIDSDTPAICRNCSQKSAALFAAAGYRPFLASKYVNQDDALKAAALLPAEDDRLKDFVYEGLRFDDVIKASLLHYLRIGREQPTAEYYAAYRRLLISALLIHWAQARLLDEYRPDVVVVINGLFYPGMLLVEHAKKRGIRHITYERGYLIDRLVFSDTTPVVWFPIDKAWEKWRDKPLTAAENKVLDDYLDERMYGKRSEIKLWDKPDFNRPEFLAKYNVRKYRRVLALFTNVLWDSAVVGCDESFPSIFDWLKAVIGQIGARPDTLLFIRVHPAELKPRHLASREKVADFLAREYPQLPPNVVVIGPEEPTSSYMIMELADGVLVNTSITGLEAACKGKPVIVAGKTHYKNKGLTIDARDQKEFAAALAALCDGRELIKPAQAVETARRYAYTFFFRYMIDFPFFAQHLRVHNPVLLKYRSVAELQPGANASLDAICSFILGEKGLWE
ncbi:MAG: hypothetical protein WC529_06980 [Candidatus Margulisiibacteriota bacterium]